MAKILPFRKVKKEVKKQNETVIDISTIADDVSAIMNDYSLTPANRHWILENMLMNIDEHLEEYKKELERAERKLAALVRSAEKDIAAAYSDFESHVLGMTNAVKNLTRSSSRPDETSKSASIAASAPEPS